MRASRRWIAVIVGILVSAGLLVLALRDVDGPQLLTTLESARVWVIAPFLGLLFAYYWVKTVRWAYLLRSVVPVAPRDLFAPVMVGYAAGALLPLQLGEVVRAWAGAERLKVRMGATLMSIALERVFDLLSILLLAGLAFNMAETASAWLSTAIVMLGAGSLVLLTLFFVFVFHTDKCVEWARTLLGALPDRTRERILEQLRAAATGLETLRRARAILYLLALSCLQWLFMFVCIWLSLHAMHIEVPLVAAALVTVFTVIGTSLPNSPGYVGSIQLAFSLALEPFGVDATTAIAASLFFHVLAYLSVVVAGALLLPTLGVSVRDVVKRVEASPGTAR